MAKPTLNSDVNAASCKIEVLDEDAFEMLFKENFSVLCAFCQMKFGFELDTSKEVVHTAFIRLWEIRDTLSFELSVKAYLYKIVSNNCLNVLRHGKVKKRYEKKYLESNARVENVVAFDRTDYKKLSNDIIIAVEKLPSQMREIFILSRSGKMKHAAIAAHLNISVKTVETQIRRALIKLKQKLSPYLVSMLPLASILWS